MEKETPLKVAFFADTAPQFLERALKQEMQTRGKPLELLSLPFVSPLVVQSELAAFHPDVVVLWFAVETAQTRGFADIAQLLSLPYTFLVFNMVTFDDGVCGSHSLVYAPSIRAQQQAWNMRLVELVRDHPNLMLMDLDLLQSRLGRTSTFDARLWEMASVALVPEVCPVVAQQVANILCATRGVLRKVVVVDLDDTLWTGTVGEVGAEHIDPSAPGRQRFQRWLKALAARGILLAVASKNDAEIARSAFSNAAMLLSLNDFSAFEASWEHKAVLLQRIADTLHVALDALVFLDNLPEERAAIREHLPNVTVPELPQDPALWVEFLAEQNMFETLAITADDAHRAEMLHAEGQRKNVSLSVSPEQYLASLKQELLPEPLSPENRERVAQLTQRCNQFNMRNTRHTVADLVEMEGWVYRLRDRFGDMGIVSAVLLQNGVIETWVLSCRAFNRGLEKRILDHLKSLGPIHGDYRPSDRNGRCKDVYRENGIPCHE
ncbi:MAG: HAD-IIIC family phosphatase [Kiritimatiellia bacterium]